MKESVLVRVARGDSQAVRECIDEFGGLVWAIARRIPAALVTEMAEYEPVANRVWIEAKAHNDFARFAPYLERTYNRSMQRRLIFDVVRKLAGMGDPPRGPDIVMEARKAAEKAAKDAAKAAKAAEAAAKPASAPAAAAAPATAAAPTSPDAEAQP